MGKILAVFLSVFIVHLTHAENFNIGGKEITIPSPQGFSIVTQQMNAVYRMTLQMTDPVNDQLAVYISESEIPTAMSGEIPLMERSFILKVNKQLKNLIVGPKDFAELKEMTRKQNKDLVESLKSEISNNMKDVSEDVSEEFEIDFAMKISQMIPLDPHYETDNAIAFSMYINNEVSTEGAQEKMIVSVTATYVNVSGKVLFLYCYGLKDELEWTRNASKLWAEKVIDSNIKPPARSSDSIVIDWKRVLDKAIIGAVTGGLIGLIFWAFSNFKKLKMRKQ